MCENVFWSSTEADIGLQLSIRQNKQVSSTVQSFHLFNFVWKHCIGKQKAGFVDFLFFYVRQNDMKGSIHGNFGPGEDE